MTKETMAWNDGTPTATKKRRDTYTRRERERMATVDRLSSNVTLTLVYLANAI